jgi:dipeptidyl aminopeptidase/acylaminoacyl peptidase
VAQALVPAASTLVSRPGPAKTPAGVETSLDAARKSATQECVRHEIVAAQEDFQIRACALERQSQACLDLARRPAFSPDGQKIAFVSDRSGAADIWVSPVSGGEPRKLTSLRPGEIPMWPSWSPDGTKIASFSRRTGVNYAYETDVHWRHSAPESRRRLHVVPPVFGRRKIDLYVSNAGHRFRIWRQPLAPNSDAEPLAAAEVRIFRISKDRRFLYFLQSGDAPRLTQLNLAAKEEKSLWTFADSLVAFDAWDVAGKRAFLRRHRAGAPGSTSVRGRSR